MKIMMSKEETIRLIQLGLESDDSPVVIRGDNIEVQVSMTPTGCSLYVTSSLLPEAEEDQEQDE